MARATANHDGEEHGLGHIVGYGPLFYTAFGPSSDRPHGLRTRSTKCEFNMLIALSIAGFKATLVCLYFMHLRWDRPFNALMLVGSIGFAVLPMVFVLMDSDQYSPQIVAATPTTCRRSSRPTPWAPIAADAQLD